MSNLAERLPETIRRAADAREAEHYSGLPAKVKSYDPTTQTADLEPMVREPIVNDEIEDDVDHLDLPILPNVRVVFMSAGSIGVTMPIPVGTEGIFMAATLQISEFRRTGNKSDAVDVRRSNLGCGGWFFPCKLSDGQPIDHAAVNALVLEAAEIRLGKNASVAPVCEPALTTWIGQLLAALAGASSPAGPVTYVPALPSAPSIAAQKVKVEP